MSKAIAKQNFVTTQKIVQNNQRSNLSLPKGVCCWDVMRLDDVSKLLVLDPLMKFTSRKIYKNSVVDDPFKSELLKLLSENLPFVSGQVLLVKEKLLELCRREKLYMSLNVSYPSWLDPFLMSYLQAVSLDSCTTFMECNRYSGDNYKGLKVIASKFIPKNTKLSHLIGFYQSVNSEAKLFLESQNLDFSLMESKRNKNSVLMLGPVAMINHDCNPNCEYSSLTKSSITINTLKDVCEGEELFCYYSSNYFGHDNQLCQCFTCEVNKEGSFKESCESVGYQLNTSLEEAHSAKSLLLNKKIDSSYISPKIADNKISISQLDRNQFYNLCFKVNILDIHENHTLRFDMQECLQKKNSFQWKLYFNATDITGSYITILENLFLKAMESKSFNIKYYNNDLISFGQLIQISVHKDCLNLYTGTKNKNLYNSYHFDNNLPAILEKESLSNNNCSKQLSIVEVDSNLNLKDTSCFNDSNKTAHLEPQFPLMQWCDTCRKGTVTHDVNEVWHNLLCNGKLQTKCNSIPRVLVTYPEPVPKKRRPFCSFCASFVHQFPRHLKLNHSTEPIVHEMLNAKDEKRKILLDSIRNRGYGVYFKYTGVMIPSRPIRSQAKNVEKVQCRCGSFFSKKTLWCHKCPSQ